MSGNCIIVLGGPDSGKTNYIGRLWLALKSKRHALVSTKVPLNIGYVLDTAENLCEGRFAPRSEHTESRRDFEIEVASADGRLSAEVVVPDISGELWKSAVETAALDADWMEVLELASGALIFVRVNSQKNIDALNWVTSAPLLARLGRKAKMGIPTQVMLCEFVRFLELKLARRPNGRPPRVAIVVTAWDSLDMSARAKGPEHFLLKNYPLFAGRLKDTALDAKVFGLSIVGGDLQGDADFKEQFLNGSIDDHGWVSARNDVDSKWAQNPDLTLPIAWAVGL